MALRVLPRLLLLVLSLLSARAVMAGAPGAPTVSINSGNPRYPFPQFMRYGGGFATLAENNPAGVPHAEMEQWTRDAWQIFVNQFQVEATYLGVNYIRANLGCPYDCTEGDGYALIAAAYMGDKTLFDGIWMRFHDTRLRKRPRYRDNVIAEPTYRYGDTPKDNADSATDGDMDAALGILMAWYQWGDLMGRNDSAGVPISYRQEAEYAIRALVKLTNSGWGDDRSTTGEIGFDGYIKHSNTGPGEMTNWANCPNTRYNGPACPEYGGANETHIDYAAPAYFHCFTDFLLNRAGLPANSFEVVQMQRAEASSDWLMGQMFAQNLIPTAGWTTVTGATATFRNFTDGEDFRNPWRTILNRVWNGNPTTTWNPTTHQVAAGSNTFEYDIGYRFGQYLRNPMSFGGQGCISMGTMALTFNGPNTIASYVDPATKVPGTPPMNYALNWFQGTGSPSAIILQDTGLMADMFRQNLLEWDGSAGTDKYLTSVPGYFHGFFRWLGLDILAGNHPDPCDLVAPGGTPPANLKIYKSVDRTYAFPGDTLTFWLNYRNYASAAATTVRVVDTLPAALAYVSSSFAGGGSVATAGQVVTWSLPNVPGFVSGGLAATLGGITLVARVTGVDGRFCNTASISCANGSGWISNEYPNEISTVMRRNCVDIVPELLSLTKTAQPGTACSGDRVTFSIAYRNNPGPWLNGGRPGVRVSIGNDGVLASSNQLVLRSRIFHGADEPVIDYGNYRIGYYINDAANPPGSWLAPVIASQGIGTTPLVTLIQQPVPPGPTWNQRLLIQFPSFLAATAEHMQRYGPGARQHWGAGDQPMRMSFQVHNAAWTNVNWSDDWSADPAGLSPEDGLHFPITADWTSGNGTSAPVVDWHPDDCQTATHTVSNALVEEWDGYTWRRAFGNGPVSGRQMSNVTIADILPACLTFGGFVGLTTPAGSYNAGSRTVSWNIPQLLVNESGIVQFWVTVGACGAFSNSATISAINEKSVSSTANVLAGAACGGTPTRTPTRTPSPSVTRTPSPSASPTRTGTPSASPTRTASSSPTRSPSPSGTPTGTPSASSTRTVSPSPSGSPTRTASPSATVSVSPSASRTASPTHSPSRTASPSVTASPSRTPTPTHTITFLDTYTVSPTVTPTRTASPSPSPSATPSASRTVTPTPTHTITFLDTYTVSPTLTRTATPSGTPSASPSRTATPTVTITFLDTYTVSPTVTSTVTLSGTPSASPTVSSTRTVSPTPTHTITFLDTYTVSPTLTRTATPTATRTATPTATITFLDTYTVSPTATSTASATPTSTATRTGTLTRTSTRSATPPATVTFTPSVTATPSNSPFATATATPTVSPAISPTVTPTRVLQFYEQSDLITEGGLYPNPFTDKVRIYFNLRTDATVTLTVYNVAGEVIFIRDYGLPWKKQTITWEGDNASGGRCASGVYILRLQAVGIDRSNGGYWTTAVIQR